MKLQLTVFAQNLKPISDEGCHPFAVVAEICAEPDTTPTVLGKTESLRNTLDPDFTKIFILRDFVLGKPMHVLVALHDAKHSNQKIGSAIFDVGSVLGTKGGVLGKELKSGGYLMVHVERTSGMGSLNLKLRGLEFTSKEEQVDPYFELQKKRQTTSGETVWDVVFRSMPVENTVNPIWSEISMDLGALCGGKRNASFRITVKDYDDSDDTLIGSCFVTVDKLLKNVTEGADTDAFDEVNDDKAIRLIRPGPTRETGKILVAAASITDAEDVDLTSLVEGEATLLRATPPAPEEEEDIVMELSNDVETVPDDLNSGANFVDYISGGCQLRVVVAIDYTASNGTSNLGNGQCF